MLQISGLGIPNALHYGHLAERVDRFSRNRQEEENTITFRLKCIVIA